MLTPQQESNSQARSVIDLDHIVFRYQKDAAPALDDVTLSIKEHEYVAILGSNGSGKSTLADIVCGLIAPQAGRLTLFDEECANNGQVNTDAYEKVRSHFGLVFQDPEDQIITTCTEDDVAFGPENLGLTSREIDKRVKAALKTVALTPLAKSNPLQLSGGQQQRVAIAGALALQGDVFIADEPSAMLDVRGRTSMAKLLHKLHNQGKTIVHITHFVDEVQDADRVIVLEKGKIALEGTPREVFLHTKKLYELGLELPFTSRLALALQNNPKPPTPRTTAVDASDKDVVPALKFEDVSYIYPKAHDNASALSHINFNVNPGEFVCIVGQTGSGKSTLARLGAGLIMPKSGTIEVFGHATDDCSHKQELRRTLGFVMQKPERQLFLDTVYDDIAFGPKNLDLDDSAIEQRAHQSLKLLQIEALKDKSPFELSGGQMRLVAIAGVLAMEPQVLILDEPMCGLDPKSKSHFRRILKNLHNAGTAIVLITHSMEDAALLSQKIVVVNKGEILLQGTPQEVFSHKEELEQAGLGIPMPLVWAQLAQEAGVEGLGSPLTLQELVYALKHPNKDQVEEVSCDE